MTRIRTLPATAALACAAILAAAAQAPPPQGPPPQAPAFRSGIDLVTVDVTVLARSGQPVATLKAEDFTLLVDGSPRPIVSARLVEAATAAMPAAAAPPAPALPAVPAADAAARRRFVIVVDRDHIPAGEGQQMLQAAAKFIDSLPPGDGVALWTLPDSGTALRFGEDRAEIKRRLRLAVGTYRAPYAPWIVGRDEAIKADAGARRCSNRSSPGSATSSPWRAARSKCRPWSSRSPPTRASARMRRWHSSGRSSTRSARWKAPRSSCS